LAATALALARGLRGSEAAANRDELFGSWLTVLDVLSGPKPVVWIIDDLHQAGGDVQDFMELAAAEPSPGRMVLATARPTGRYQPAAGIENGILKLMPLAPLSNEDAARLVRALVGGALSRQLTAKLVDRSEGNPLFIEETLRAWAGVGQLIETDGRWRLVAPPTEVVLPATIQGLYSAQLDDLPPAARDLVRRASVVGRRFPRAALSPLGVTESPALDELLTRGLLQGPADQPILGPSYSFRHALLQEVAYSGLARAQRARLHVRYAGWLQGLPGQQDLLASSIGSHYAAALDALPRLEQEFAEGLQRAECTVLAADWLERGALAELGQSARDAAAEHLRLSLELTGEQPSQNRLRRLTGLGETLRQAHALPDAMATFENAASVASWLGRADRFAASAIAYENAFFASRLPRPADGGQSVALLTRSLAHLHERDGEIWSEAMAALGRALYFSGQVEAGHNTSARACVAALATSSRRVIAYALAARRACMSAPEGLGERLELSEKMVEAANVGDDVEAKIEAGRLRLIDLLEAGQMASARSSVMELSGWIEDQGRPFHLWYPAMWRGMLALFEGELEQAELLIRRFLEEGRLCRYREVDDVHDLQLFLLRRQQGRSQEALAIADRGTSRSPVRWEPMQAVCLSDLGFSDTAGARLSQVVGEPASIPRDSSRSLYLALACEAAVRLGDRTAADLLVDLLAPYRDQNLVVGSGAACLGSANLYLGMAASACGRPAEARTLLESAIAQNSAMGSPPLTARSRAELSALEAT
jgi:hypothetical protein